MRKYFFAALACVMLLIAISCANIAEAEENSAILNLELEEEDCDGHQEKVYCNNENVWGNDARPPLDFLFETSQELLMAAEVAKNHLEMFYARRWFHGNPIYSKFAVENMSFDEFILLGNEHFTGFFEGIVHDLNLMYITPEELAESDSASPPFLRLWELMGEPGDSILTRELYYDMLSNDWSLIYAVMFADISNSGGRDEVIITAHLDGWGSNHVRTEVFKWCDDDEVYLLWFSLWEARRFEIVQIGGVNFIMTGASSKVLDDYWHYVSYDFKFFDILHIQGNEARGLRVGYDDRPYYNFSPEAFGFDDLLEDYNFIHPAAFIGIDGYENTFVITY